MNKKPNDIDIIDYLYGDLSPIARQEFEDYMHMHKEFAEEINQLRLTQNILPALPDEEVIAPFTNFTSSRSLQEIRSSRKWIYPLSIAASLGLILLVGYLTNFSVSLKNGDFNLGFKSETSTPNGLLSSEDVQRMIDHKAVEISKSWSNQINLVKSDFSDQLDMNEELTESKIKQVAAQRMNINDDEISAFISQLEDENLKAIQSFYQASAKEQQQYMRSILLEFNEYLEGRRSEDLDFIRANLLQMQNSTVQKQEETDKILASIITTVNSQAALGQ